MIYLGSLYRGGHIISVYRVRNLIRWTVCNPEGVVDHQEGPPHQAHDAIRDWITSVTDDWTVQAELRRRALDIRYRIDHKETDPMMTDRIDLPLSPEIADTLGIETVVMP